MPSDGKSSHCLWQGELKSINIYVINSIITLAIQITKISVLELKTCIIALTIQMTKINHS
jgi:hypothetical protein